MALADVVSWQRLPISASTSRAVTKGARTAFGLQVRRIESRCGRKCPLYLMQESGLRCTRPVWAAFSRGFARETHMPVK